MEKLDWGDTIFYCDSGSYFIRSVAPLVNICQDVKQNIVVFELPRIEKHWTKRDAFILMGCDSPEYAESKQRLSSYCLMKKTNYVLEFIDEYLNYAQDERIITDIDNQCGYPNYWGFKEHRHDQSILSLLTKKHGIIAYRDPSQFGSGAKDYANSPYDQIIQLTRRRNRSLLSRLLEKIKKIL